MEVVVKVEENKSERIIEVDITRINESSELIKATYLRVELVLFLLYFFFF